MDRKIVWPGQVPLETDLLGTNRNVMIALGRLAMDLLGASTLVSGLSCTPTSPASMKVGIGAGAIYSLQNVDNSAYSSLAPNTTDQIMKQGILLASDAMQLTLSAPATPGNSVIYLVQAAFSEDDGDSTILSFYNAANPSVPFAGPSNSNTPSATTRAGNVNINAKAGVASGSPVAPSADTGFVPLYYVTLTYGQTTITSGNIAVASGAPFITGTLGSLSSYLTIAAAASTYATQSSLGAYLLSSTAASTYAPLASPAFTGTPTAPTKPISDNNTELATTAAVYAALGPNRTWQDLTSAGGALARAVNTTYTNGNSYEIQVQVAMTCSAAGYYTWTMNGFTMKAQGSFGTTNGGTVVFNVPPGGTYSVGCTAGTPALVQWAEYR